MYLHRLEWRFGSASYRKDGVRFCYYVLIGIRTYDTRSLGSLEYLFSRTKGVSRFSFFLWADCAGAGLARTHTQADQVFFTETANTVNF